MTRRGYLFRKIGLALVTIVVVVVINFLLFRVLPGDPVRSVIGRNVRISVETQLALREQFQQLQPLGTGQGLADARDLLIQQVFQSCRFHNYSLTNVRMIFNAT